VSAFANCGRAVAHVRGSYGPNSDIRMLLLGQVLPADWYCDLKNRAVGV
jgi:hypothetical protein